MNLARTPHVMLVDDDGDIRGALSEMLESEGYAVTCASNGREALTLLRAHARADVVLLDQMMPVMNGAEFRAEQMRDPGLAAIPVVILSASHTPREEPEEPAFVPKPIDVDHLLHIVARLTRR